jgi:predicted enzyme related to lactoylglutathione lyase
LGGIGASYGEGDTGVRISVRVDDLDAYIAKAEPLGGSKLVPPTTLPGDYGSFAVVTDPDGNAVGLWP